MLNNTKQDLKTLQEKMNEKERELQEIKEQCLEVGSYVIAFIYMLLIV
jgi:hypothetical protein